jgi:glycosyltransferase involved in cell wall biosynthesis
MADTTIVIPCYNEAARLDVEAFNSYLDETTDVDVLFVNDGSTDATAAVLEGMKQAWPDRVDVLELEKNQGKAEAVRRGMTEAAKRDCQLVGFWDADLSTPLSELDEFRACLRERSHFEMVFGARVNLLGRSVRRNLFRHYLSRLFATLAAFVLGLGVYDTQCGAKLFRNSPDIAALFDQPFISRWIFDVEVIARLIKARRAEGRRAPEEVIFECPLMEWYEIRGSKIRVRDLFLMSLDLIKIIRHYAPRGGR